MRRLQLMVALAVFAGILLAFWIAGSHSSIAVALGTRFLPAFAAFALLLAPLWFGGFAGLEAFDNVPARLRVLMAGALATPYFVLTAGTPAFHWRSAVIVVAFPVLIAAFLQAANPEKRTTWRDGFVLGLIAVAYFQKWFQGIWLSPEVLPFSKLFLADVTLYGFPVIRKLEGTGYSLVPTRTNLAIGLREWLLYIPVALPIGLLTGFIHFHAIVPSVMQVAGIVPVTFFLIALPEEMFFRSVLQNLLESRIGRTPALIVAAVLFGLSHFNHGATFNWRYVLLAGIAGVFYGRAWRARRSVLASSVTHTAVDVVWSLWFR